MSVSDPLIKQIKGYTLKLTQEENQINDENKNFIDFVIILEKILYQGLLKSDPFIWMTTLNKTNLTLNHSIDIVTNTKNIFTKLGRCRHLIRILLVKKALHLPIAYLIENDLNYNYYQSHSILGGEILSQIFYSVILQISCLNFNLNIENTSFLDYTWIIPKMMKLELVPCKNIGIKIGFSNEKAIIIEVESNSVAAETGNICVGDVLDYLNDIPINSSSKGRLSNIFFNNKGRPITMKIIKFYYNNQFFNPIQLLLKDINENYEEIKKSYENTPTIIYENDENYNRRSGGFKAFYIGSISVGSQGSTEEIDKAIRIFISLPKIEKKLIHFEICEMGIKVTDYFNGTLLLKHSYMQISSCASAKFLPNYFAFISGDTNCDISQNFTCYIFNSDNLKEISTILESMGQGFHRTHYAV